MRQRLLPLVALLAAGAAAAEAASSTAPNPARVEELAQMLAKSPRGVGRPITDRQAWDAAARHPRFQKLVGQAEQVMAKPMPELTDEFFIECARIGDRKRCGPVLGARHSRYPRLVLAECIENQGRFLPAIDEAIRAVCSESTWLHPAHDRSLRNVKRQVIEIDLCASAEAWNMATAYYWLGTKLSPATRKLVRDELERRVFRPFEGMVTRGKPRTWWLKTTSNWNAVCLAGVTGAALTMIESPQRRAFFVASAEKHIQSFRRGFTPAGFCSEGLGYWGYGFGRFTMLAEAVGQATGGQLDLFDDDQIRQVAQFARRMEILPGVYPAFADCNPKTRPSPRLMAFLSRRVGMGLRDVERRGLLLAAGPSACLYELGLFGFPNSASAMPAAEPDAASRALRDWFPDAGCLICRPAPGTRHALGVAIKGGHNAEHHNHNDVGTFVVALGRKTPLVDPGSEYYTGRTFSSRRYESNVLNSFGHPVPRVAGSLQMTGRGAAAKVLKTEFTDTTDTIVFDIRSAYDVKPLKKLHRTFAYSREGAGRLTVTDEVEFASPQSFGTALITFDKWRRAGPTGLIVGEGAEAVQVSIATSGQAVEIQPTEIKEDLHGRSLPTRLGIALAEPVAKATITLTIAPAPAPH